MHKLLRRVCLFKVVCHNLVAAPKSCLQISCGPFWGVWSGGGTMGAYQFQPSYKAPNSLLCMACTIIPAFIGVNPDLIGLSPNSTSPQSTRTKARIICAKLIKKRLHWLWGHLIRLLFVYRIDYIILKLVESCRLLCLKIVRLPNTYLWYRFRLEGNF